jgi:hypothetical protein
MARTGRRPLAPAAPLVLLFLGAAPLAAQEDEGPNWSISAVASTLGLGGELSGRANPIVGVRGGYYLFGWSTSEAVEGISYDLKPKLRNGTALLDLYPGGGWFRLSGGIVYGSPEVRAVGQLTGPVTIGSTTYPPAAVGTLNGRAYYTKGIRRTRTDASESLHGDLRRGCSASEVDPTATADGPASNSPRRTSGPRRRRSKTKSAPRPGRSSIRRSVSE